MALTIASECDQAAMTGITGLLTGGAVRFDTAGDVEVAVLPIASIGASTNASPSTSVLTLTADATPNDDATITKFLIRTSGAATRINGSVGVGSGDLQVTDNVVPVGATEISCSGGLTLSLNLS